MMYLVSEGLRIALYSPGRTSDNPTEPVDIFVKPGQKVKAGDPLFKIIDAEKVLPQTPVMGGSYHQIWIVANVNGSRVSLPPSAFLKDESGNYVYLK